jgi:hypothetical protein
MKSGGAGPVQLELWVKTCQLSLLKPWGQMGLENGEMKYAWLKVFQLSIQVLLKQLEAQKFEAMKVLVTGAGEHHEWYLDEMKDALISELTAQKNLELPFVKDELLAGQAMEGKFELRSFYLKNVVEYVEIMAKAQTQRAERAVADYEKLKEVFPANAAEIKNKCTEMRRATMEMWLECKEISRMW